MTRSGYLSLLAALASLPVVWADDPVVFRSDVALVRVDAQVVNRDNRPITGLGLRDFVLRESGKAQTIQAVDAEKMPIDLLLLLDVSASMRPHVQRIANASHEAMRQLREDDRIAIMVFDRATRVRMGFRNGRAEVEREMQRLLDQENFGGGTDITRGLLDAAAFIGRVGRPEARKAIVIVTDDQTERNRDVEGVSRALTRADAVLSALIAPDAMRNRDMRRNGGGYPGGGYPGGGYPGGGYPGGGGGLGGIILGRPRGGYGGNRYPGGGGAGAGTHSAGTEEIALSSGGDSMPVDDGYALQDTLARIRQRYALHFNLPPGVLPGEERNIQLELAGAIRSRYPGADIRYRHSYYAPAGAGSYNPVSSEPVVVTGRGTGEAGTSPAPPADPDRPTFRRRAGVSQVPDTQRGGPMIHEDGPAPASAPPAASGPAWRKAEPDPPPASATDTPGWRKARPGEQP
jgi:VWFA-related protein